MFLLDGGCMQVLPTKSNAHHVRCHTWISVLSRILQHSDIGSAKNCCRTCMDDQVAPTTPPPPPGGTRTPPLSTFPHFVPRSIAFLQCLISPAPRVHQLV